MSGHQIILYYSQHYLSFSFGFSYFTLWILQQRGMNTLLHNTNLPTFMGTKITLSKLSWTLNFLMAPLDYTSLMYPFFHICQFDTLMNT